MNLCEYAVFQVSFLSFTPRKESFSNKRHGKGIHFVTSEIYAWLRCPSPTLQFLRSYISTQALKPVSDRQTSPKTVPTVSRLHYF